MIGKMCAKCNIELRCKKNEVYVIEHASFGPYKLWMADLWNCAGCGAEMVLGFGANPIREHFQPDFQGYIAELKDNDETIIDCYERLAEVK